MIMAESAMPMQPVRVVKSATCGRGLVFTSNFAPGQCILEEFPYVYTLLDNKKGLFCDFCLKQCSTLKKCTRCNDVSYCNKSCQKADWTRCHKQDCKTLKKYPDLETHLLSQIIHKQERSPPCTQDDKDCFPTIVEQLESHHEQLRDSSNMLVNHKILTAYDYCIEEGVLIEPSSLLKMLGAILCNSFGILDNELIVIAEGIYLRASMLNHSCDPNCAGVFDERKLQIRTIKDVKEGEECTINYVNVINPAKERQTELEEKYHFTCKCLKCVEEINPDDGLGEKLQGPKKSWEQIQDAEKSQDWAKVLQLCEPYLKPMDSSSSLPANHHLLVKIRGRAFGVCFCTQSWEKAVEAGQLNTESYRYHYGPYSASWGMHLLVMGKLLLDLERFQEARRYITEAKSVLEVTHGPQHSLMMTPLVQKLFCRFR